MYARYLCSRDALGLKAEQARRATIGYLVYKLYTSNMKTRRKTSTSDMCLRRRNAVSLPLVFSTHGGCAPEADKFHKREAKLLAKKINIPYSEAISYVRRRVRFSELMLLCKSSQNYNRIYIFVTLFNCDTIRPLFDSK